MATRERSQDEVRQRLDEMMRGYQPAVILLAAGHLGLFTALGERTRTAAELARERELDARAVRTVLLALAGLGVVERDGEGFRLSPAHAPFLLPGGAQSLASILDHNHHLLQRWARLAEVVRNGRPLPRGERTGAELRAFICGMADISRASSAELARLVDLSDRRRLLDVGGGPGTSSIALARRWPQLECVVFDLPEPLAIAREQIAAAGLAARVTVRAGDYFADELGEGFDTVYLSNIVHSLGPAQNRMLLEKCRRAVGEGGLILVKDFLLDDSLCEPAGAAVFSVNMLIATEAGRSYAVAEIEAQLTEAGFVPFGVVRIGSHSRVVLARAA